jgi:hypothetical protein
VVGIVTFIAIVTWGIPNRTSNSDVIIYAIRKNKKSNSGESARIF